MGDATETTSKTRKAAVVAVRVRASAHVDVADLAEGAVSKTAPLVMDAAAARDLVKRHPYLEALEG
jgi:hypothetical protein